LISLTTFELCEWKCWKDDWLRELLYGCDCESMF